MKKVIILSSAGKGIGLGHVIRCMEIQKEFLEENIEVKHFVDAPNVDFGLTQFKDWTKQSLEYIIEDADIVIIDSYKTNFNWLEFSRFKDRLIIHLDDYNRLNYPVDVILNPNVFFSCVDYSNQSAEVIGGSKYVIIRREFESFQAKKEKNNKPVVLITVGGSDYRDLLPTLIESFPNDDLYKIRVITDKKIESSRKNLKVMPLLNSQSLVNEICKADIIISGSGQTLNELYILKKKVIGICIDEDQELNHKFYNSIKFIEADLFWNQSDLGQKIQTLIKRKLESDSRIENPNILTFEGARNIVSEILKIYDRLNK